MRQSAEVGIVGAGPAGSRAAELLVAQGVDVVLLDSRVPWEKPCGGGLTAHVFDELPEMEAVKSLARPLGRARLELSPDEGFEVELDRPVWMISRKALGQWQLDRALAAGASHEPVRVRTIRRTRRGWMLDTDRGPLSVPYLVGADGAASTVRNVAAPGFAVELVPARVAYPPVTETAPDFLVLRFYSELVGYLWDFARPDHHSIGIEVATGGLRRPELDRKIDEYCEQHGESQLATLEPVGAVIGTARLGHGDFSGVAGDGFALLGDAAGFADPFTGEGIRNALRSAGLLAEAWKVGGSGGKDAKDFYRALARDTFATEFIVARLLRRSLSESGLGVRLLEWALSSDFAYAVVAATLNSATIHDYGLRRLVTRSRRALREVRSGRGRRALRPRSS